MNQLHGRWQIVWMEEWGQDYVDLVEPGYFRFEPEDGQFVFGDVQGWIDPRYSADLQRVDFSWQGVSAEDDLCGRGWFAVSGPGQAEGRLFIHNGDESGVSLRRQA